jgi:site-specific DNA-methyltransferase (adenine-specific)
MLPGMDTDRIITGDCLDVLPTLPGGVVDLVATDPPFNIGRDYPGYDDNLPPDVYLAKLAAAFREVRRVLSPTGGLFVAIGWQVEAEVCLLLKGLGFRHRNTIPWHYTFGPCQRRKFTPSHTPILYFVMGPRRFTFNADAVRVPSARQTDYADRRANPAGKVPDDVWLLRPEEAEAEGFFRPDGDVWHVPRVAGTFKERQDHDNQMPVALLERIVRVASNPGDLVLDPYAGTGTTLVAARRLGRRYLGIELCGATADRARERVRREQGPIPGLEC